VSRVVVDGRIPPGKVDAAFHNGLLQVLRDLAEGLKQVTDIVMAKAVHSPALTADALVKTGQGTYRGISITATTAGAAIDIRDAVAAGAGTIIDTIPAGTAAGTYIENVVGVTCETGIYVDYNVGATGTVVVLYE
jgi:hypothetical protein